MLYSGSSLTQKSSTFLASKTCILGVRPFCLMVKLVCISSANDDINCPNLHENMSRAAGQDATDAFYGLHRHEILERPQYARLQIGTIKGESSVMQARTPGQLSKVPFAEPTWLSEGYHSPYYKEASIFLYFRFYCAHIQGRIQSHRRLQQAMRQLVDDVIYPDAQAREEDGKRPSLDVIHKMAYEVSLSNL